MRRIIGIVSILLMSLSVSAQQVSRAEKAQARQERIHAIKIGYLTDRLDLTAAQAASFWPVYNEYEAELREARKAFRKKYAASRPETNAEAERMIEENLELQERILDIKRKYKDRMLKVISAQQLASLYEAEKDFNKLLLKQLQQRREGGAGRGMRR